MNTSKIIAISGILLSVILIAGCLGGGETKGQAGFGEDSLGLAIDTEGRDVFESNENFVITMDIENYGPFDVTDVTTKLVGFGGIKPNPSNATKLSEPVDLAEMLNRPRPDQEMAGGFATRDWDVTAPTVTNGAPDVSIKLTGQVFYTTKSLAVQKVVIADKDYIVQLEERGEVVPVNPQTESLNGPVSVDVEVADPYVVVRSTTDSNMTVKLILNNDGSGNLYARPSNERDYLEKVTLSYPTEFVPEKNNCDFTVESTGVLTAIPTKLRMMEGGLNRELSCRFTIPKGTVEGYQTYELNAEADYTYLQDIVRDIIIEPAED